MADLIQIGRAGVLAYQGALAAVGENVTNANNDGYAKRNVVLKEQVTASGAQYLSYDLANFNGVSRTNVARAFDQYKATTAWNANSDAAFASTKSQYLTTVQSQLDDTDSGIGTRLTAVFTAGSALSANPTDTTLRQSMVYAIQDATGAIGQASANLDKVSTTIGQQATAQVSSLNTALQQLATLNINLETSPEGSAGRASLEDQRDTLIGTISGSVGVDVSFDAKGAASIKLNDYAGTQLVTPTSNVASLVNLSRANDGQLSVSITLSDGSSAAPTPTSGSLAGFVNAASNVADRKRQLDTMATDFATALNTWNKQGTDNAGNPGADLLTGTDAQSLALAATVTSDSIAAKDASGANGNLLKLSALRGTTGVEQTWHNIINSQALQVSAATTASTTASAQKDSAYSAMDAVSGVNLDNEAADLLRFQQAYSASSKIIQAAKDTFQTILNLL